MLSPTRARATLLAAGVAVAGLLMGSLAATPSAASDQESCRPDGLYETPGAAVLYCSVYDTEGREKMDADHQRRVIGYFTGWRTGKDGKPTYLASDIPWDKVTHLNYAFAHVDGGNKISVGADGPDNASTGMTWPGVAGAEMDPDLPVSFDQFPLGDSNCPISPKLKITNNTKATPPGGTEFQFDYATSAPANAKDQSGFGTTTVRSDHTAANNIGGLKGDYNRVSLKLPAWQSLAPGASVQVDFVYYLPTSTPSNWTVAFGGKSYALTADLARGTTPVDPGTGTSSPSPDPSTGTGPTPGGDCAAPAWSAGSEYGAGTTVSHGSHQWKAKWWTKGETPGSTGDWGAWQDLGACCPSSRTARR
ncbi:chitinase C-terminal domain-containing protein [Streptomyces sp. NBC_01363]|uniref:chitinase C-terminal domain-containing protein n=1 Tax=Streptomyces sp. NBC_01363 TaxID=2903840 RepID=UPI002250DA6C|nr:chitinase C-terminal domain-containing protein [Streptomyces sp. NBC_01363]MCX4733373.1 chitinase C-terminal domain-containing protein [Streptomyces sp. NBC_01363]